jgi:hypothetical protein
MNKMGATEFFTTAKGATASEAFKAAVKDAEYEHGHGGYSGTIAEKRSFTMIAVPKDQEPIAYANDLLDDDDGRISDKWGPAGCVKISDDEFAFFGWASC